MMGGMSRMKRLEGNGKEEKKIAKAGVPKRKEKELRKEEKREGE